MALDATAMAAEMKEKIDALPPGSAGLAVQKAMCEAIVEHIQANAQVQTPGVQAQGAPFPNGSIT